MIDALLYSVRDAIRAAGMGYGKAECEIMSDGKPTPRCGNWFVAVHGGVSHPGSANRRNLHEVYDFSVTLTGRVTVPMDRVGDQLVARNLPLRGINDVPLAQRQGFNARVDQLRALLHMNWGMTVAIGSTPASANDNLAAWSADTVYGFVLPAACQGSEFPTVVGGEWMGAEPEDDSFALKSEMRFAGAERFQPQTAPAGFFL